MTILNIMKRIILLLFLVNVMLILSCSKDEKVEIPFDKEILKQYNFLDVIPKSSDFFMDTIAIDTVMYSFFKDDSVLATRIYYLKNLDGTFRFTDSIKVLRKYLVSENTIHFLTTLENNNQIRDTVTQFSYDWKVKHYEFEEDNITLKRLFVQPLPFPALFILDCVKK